MFLKFYNKTYIVASDCQFAAQMSDDNPFVIPEMEPTLCKQIQECNWQVVNLTTPANYFHALRRQVCLYTLLFSPLLPS